jgi:hypothetical protein
MLHKNVNTAVGCEVLIAVAMNSSIFSLLPASCGFLLGLLLNPEDGGGMFLQNAG